MMVRVSPVALELIADEEAPLLVGVLQGLT
jgi:hypothetical protein